MKILIPSYHRSDGISTLDLFAGVGRENIVVSTQTEEDYEAYKRAHENRAKFDGMTMAEYMRWLWNNPQAGQNLYKMFEGIVVPTGKDEDGNLIYKYKGGK